MSDEIVLPQLETAGGEIYLAAWLKQPGDRVRAGEVIAEVQTDKVNLEIPSPTTGVIDTILAKVGDVVSEGQVIARVARDTRPAQD